MDDLLQRLACSVRHQHVLVARSRLMFPNVCSHWLDVTVDDSGPVLFPEAECQGVIRHLVVKFGI